MISIIIPVYNGEKYLQRCLDSIQHQTYTDFEVIVVDDGSTDGSGEISDNMAKTDSRFHVIHQNNAGVSDARNTALAQTKGDVAFIDADDYVDSNYLEKLRKGLEHPEVDISFCAIIEEDEWQNIMDVKGVEKDIIIDSDEFKWDEEPNHGTVWGAIFKKNIIDGVKFDNRFFVGEDTLFIAHCLKNARKLCFLSNPLYHYVLYQESALHGVFSLKKITGVYACEELIKLSRNSQELSTVKALLASNIRNFCNNYYSDSIFLESGYLDKLIIKYRNFKNFYFKYLIKKKKYKTLITGVAFGVCPKFYLKLREKKKSLLPK